MNSQRHFLSSALLHCAEALMILIMLGMTTLPIHAEKADSISIHGNVKDDFTMQSLEGAIITFMFPDSTIAKVDSTGKSIHQSMGGLTVFGRGGYYSSKLPSTGTYIAKVEMKGYETGYFNIHIPVKKYMKKVRSWDADFQIKKKQKIKTVNLSEARVKATRIKMVMKGDTLVYNADAFQVSDGSMLDKLIAAMPGFKVEKDGNITHNGQHVEELLVNGKEFFKGNPKIALENLPAYTVDNVKVYRKTPPDAEMLRDTMEINRLKRLVVDIRLKRQYSQGWFVNSELAGGTHDRYLGRIFGLRYTDHSKLFLFGNMNNLSDEQQPDADGILKKEHLPSGITKVKMGGLNLNLSDKKTNAEYNGSFTAKHERTTDEQISSSVNYYEGGDTHDRYRSLNQDKHINLKFDNSFYYPVSNRFSMGFRPDANYQRTESSGFSRSATFNQMPSESSHSASIDSLFSPSGSPLLNQMLINRMSQENAGTYKNFSTNAYGWLYLRTPLLDNTLQVNYGLNYQNNENTAYSRSDLRQQLSGERDFRHQQVLTPSRHYDFNVHSTYSWNFSRLKHTHFYTGYSINQQFDRGHRDLYRFDRLPMYSTDSMALNALPSTRDEMLTAFDWQNSFHTVTRSHAHEIQFKINQKISKKTGDLTLTLPLNMVTHTISDQRNHNQEHKSRYLRSVMPDLSLNAFDIGNNGKTHYHIINYSLRCQVPDMNNLLDITDDSNPLIIRRGNPLLKNSTVHNLTAYLVNGNTKHQKTFQLSGNWTLRKNAVAQACTYNRLTGVSTYLPRNINGNWYASIQIMKQQTVDSLDRVLLKNTFSIDLSNSSDYISERSGEVTEPYRSSIRQTNVSEELSAMYTIKQTTLRLYGDINWQRLSSRREDFNKTNAFQFSYGLQTDLPLLWDVSLSSNIAMHSRRGYSDKHLNDDNLIWNASLTRSFLKGKRLTAKLEGVDLLHQLDNVRSYMNAQGRTETWYNTIPSYLMFHLYYKLHIQPKKKEEQ